MENVIPKNYDPNIPFILKYYQILPKYYFLSQSETNSLVCVMNMGTGKTSLSIFMFLDYINRYKKSQFISKSIEIDESSFLSNLLIKKPNVYFIGSWNSAFACKNDLLNSAFNFFYNDVLTKLSNLLNSTNPSNVEEGKRYKTFLLKEVNKYINFLGYQVLVNICFPTLFQKFVQNPDILLEQWRNGTLDISPNILEDFRNCFVVVDEMQRLYSTNGLNSYGVTIMILHKHAKEYNIRFLFLTGTIINNALPELTAIANLITDDRKFIELDSWTNKEKISDDMMKYTIKPEMKETIFKLFYPKMFFYNPADELSQDIPRIKKFSDDLEILQFPEKTGYPIECHVGNCVIDKEKMIVLKLKVQGVQAERYAEYLKYANPETESDEQTMIFPQDAGLPLKESDWIKHGIIKVNNIFTGSFLKLENLKNYSIIGYYMFKYAFENALKSEKTIIYHSKLNGFGLYQYGEILNVNGFVQYESSIKNNSLCIHCGKTFKDHSLSIKERLKNKVCNDFSPIVYAYLTGDTNRTDRDEIVNNIYNSPQNAYGNIITILFVSDIAYSGVSFLNTNNIFILSRISNISKWKQIGARIIRNKSHSLIKNKLAKIWTFVVYHENEKGISIGEKYYKLRLIYSLDANNFLKELSRKSIGNIILNNPKEYLMNSSQKLIFKNLLKIDLKDCLDNVISEIFKGDSVIWNIDRLLERIQSDSVSIAPLNLINLSRDYIIKHLFSSKLYIFKYRSPIKGTGEIFVSKYLERIKKNSVQIITFEQFQSITFDKKSLNVLMKSLFKDMGSYEKARIIGQIIKICSKNLSILSNHEIFWKSNFEIHNEYYENDEEEFFKNHSNRNIAKMTGIYYNDSIIKKDGTKIPIKLKFIDDPFPGFEDRQFIYRITSMIVNINSPFYLNVLVESKVKKQVKDLRKVERSLQCSSVDTNKLEKDFPKINKKQNKREFCRELIEHLCKEQLKSKIRGVYSPFEK